MEKWTVAMAGDGESEAHGCEFFITLSDAAGEKLQGKFAAFGRVIDGFDEVERLEHVPTVRVYPEGVSAVICQPVEDEYLRDIVVETFGKKYSEPVVKYWCR